MSDQEFSEHHCAQFKDFGLTKGVADDGKRGVIIYLEGDAPSLSPSLGTEPVSHPAFSGSPGPQPYAVEVWMSPEDAIRCGEALRRYGEELAGSTH